MTEMTDFDTASRIAEITACYERDMQLQPTAVAATDIPVSYEAMTDEWLTNVLCGGVPGARVVSHVLGAPDDGTSNRRRLSIAYNAIGADAGLPEELFCKASHGLANRLTLGISGGLHGEVTFYKLLRPDLSIEAPRAYHAIYDSRTMNSIIMLDDLTDKVEFCDISTAIGRNDVEQQLRLLAKLHTNYICQDAMPPAVLSLPTWTEFFANVASLGLQQGMETGFVEGESIMPARLVEQADRVWQATVNSVARGASLPETLLHGDAHLRNWYRTSSGNMGLNDWQITCRGHWTRDVAYAIVTSLSVEDRRSWERDLVAFYLNEVAELGGPREDPSEAMSAYRQQLLGVLAWWTVTLVPPEGLPDMQPKEASIELVRRIAHAVDDWEVVAEMV